MAWRPFHFIRNERQGLSPYLTEGKAQRSDLGDGHTAGKWPGQIGETPKQCPGLSWAFKTHGAGGRVMEN